MRTAYNIFWILYLMGGIFYVIINERIKNVIFFCLFVWYL
jgi:hypothetical protein